MAPKRRNPTGIILDAQLVRALRKEMAFPTHAKLAQAAEVTPKAVWKAENNEPISIENADQIARALGKRIIDIASPDVDLSVKPTQTPRQIVHCALQLDLPSDLLDFLRAKEYGRRILGILIKHQILLEGVDGITLLSGSVLLLVSISFDDYIRLVSLLTFRLRQKLKILGVWVFAITLTLDYTKKEPLKFLHEYYRACTATKRKRESKPNTVFAKDADNRIIQEGEGPGAVYTEYDKSGLMSKMKASSLQLDYSYDNSHRLIDAKLNDHVFASFDYDREDSKDWYWATAFFIRNPVSNFKIIEMVSDLLEKPMPTTRILLPSQKYVSSSQMQQLQGFAQLRSKKTGQKRN